MNICSSRHLFFRNNAGLFYKIRLKPDAIEWRKIFRPYGIIYYLKSNIFYLASITFAAILAPVNPSYSKTSESNPGLNQRAPIDMDWIGITY